MKTKYGEEKKKQKLVNSEEKIIYFKHAIQSR